MKKLWIILIFPSFAEYIICSSNSNVFMILFNIKIIIIIIIIIITKLMINNVL